MLARVADGVARAIARIRIGTVAPGPSPVKVNLGSGLQVAPGWIHVDGSIHAMCAKAPVWMLRALHRSANTVQWLTAEEYVRRLRTHRFVHRELEGRLPFQDATVDFIYLSHLLEHFYLRDARRLLAEILRVLKPGGIVRICVPDLEHAIRLYTSQARSEALSYFFTESPAPYYRQHRYMYDFALLESELSDCGFDDIRRCTYRSGQLPDLELLDNRPEETLYVEARKAI